MTVVPFHAIAELDLGREASASMTPERERAFFQGLVTAATSVVILRAELGSLDSDALKPQVFDLTAGVNAESTGHLFATARRGYRAVFVLPDPGEALRLLTAWGYELARASTGSEAFMQTCALWFGRHLPDADALLVLGHDFEPAYMFGRGRHET